MAAKHEIVGADGRRRIVDDDDGHILADGEKLVVSMMARDSCRRCRRAWPTLRSLRPRRRTGFRHRFRRRRTTSKNGLTWTPRLEAGDAWKTPTPVPRSPTSAAGDGHSRDPRGREPESRKRRRGRRRPRVPPRAMTADNGLPASRIRPGMRWSRTCAAPGRGNRA